MFLWVWIWGGRPPHTRPPLPACPFTLDPFGGMGVQQLVLPTRTMSRQLWKVTHWGV